MTRDPRIPSVLIGLLVAAVAPPVASAIELSTDQEVYVEGDVVQFTLHNPYDVTVVFPAEPPWCVQDVEMIVYPGCVSLPVLVFFEPGETIEATWDTGYLPDPPGEYVISVNWYLDQDPVEFVTTETFYTLESAVGVETSTWSALKAAYR
jgi:hypothetical protein